MSQPYVGQILMFAGNFAPAGWMMCSGQLLPISENDVLFQLLGTTYGGDGQETFGLPDLQGRIPIHMGQGSGLSNYNIGQASGTESVTLNLNQIPLHTHPLLASSQQASASTPAPNTILSSQSVSNGANTPSVFTPFNTTTPAQVTLPNTSIQNTGGNQPHDNIQPVTTLTICISLFGIFPSQT